MMLPAERLEAFHRKRQLHALKPEFWTERAIMELRWDLIDVLKNYCKKYEGDIPFLVSVSLPDKAVQKDALFGINIDNILLVSVYLKGEPKTDLKTLPFQLACFLINRQAFREGPLKAHQAMIGALIPPGNREKFDQCLSLISDLTENYRGYTFDPQVYEAVFPGLIEGMGEKLARKVLAIKLMGKDFNLSAILGNELSEKLKGINDLVIEKDQQYSFWLKVAQLAYVHTLARRLNDRFLVNFCEDALSGAGRKNFAIMMIAEIDHLNRRTALKEDVPLRAYSAKTIEKAAEIIDIAFNHFCAIFEKYYESTTYA